MFSSVHNIYSRAGFDKDHVSASTNNKIKKYIEMPSFKVEEVKKVSGAAGALCVWVHAIYIYANVAKEVAPKRQRLKEASESLAIKQAALHVSCFAFENLLAQQITLMNMKLLFTGSTRGPCRGDCQAGCLAGVLRHLSERQESPA